MRGAGLPRPLMPANADPETITRVLDWASRYSTCSVAVGLKEQRDRADVVQARKGREPVAGPTDAGPLVTLAEPHGIAVARLAGVRGEPLELATRFVAFLLSPFFLPLPPLSPLRIDMGLLRSAYPNYT